MIDALITAGARLPSDLAARYGTDVKALVKIGGSTLIARTIAAVRGVADVARVVVVGPPELRAHIEPDCFIDEKETGEKNLLAALAAAQHERALLCASDMPFLNASVLTDLLGRAPLGAGVVYPIYTRAEFEKAYPGGRSAFARLREGEFTGGSGFVMYPTMLLQHAGLITSAFAARKNLLALAAILGPTLTFAFLRNAATVKHIEARASVLLGGAVVALRGADPALAIDCDDASDFEYAAARLDGVVP